MKRFVSVLAGLLVLPAFAEVAPAYYYEDIAEVADVVDTTDTTDADVEEASAPASNSATGNTTGVNPRSAVSGRASLSRTVPAAANTTAVNSRNVNNTRGVATRTNSATVARAATTNAARTNSATATRGVAATRTNARAVSRTNNNTSTAGLTTRGNGNNNANRGVAARAATLNDGGNPLYIGRSGVRTSSVTSRVPTIRMAGTNVSNTTETITAAATDLDELAQMTDFCKAQYVQCMDNFCNVLDDNQGRCSCSRNLKNYEKTETALKVATEELQDVAQKIQYIGLTGDEVETLFTQTVAELQMQKTTDNTQLKNDLDKIKKMIVDVRGGTATTSDTGLNMDLSGLLDFSIDSTGFDLASLFGGGSSTASISNQRGENLYKTATARCKAAVLNSCTAQGVDSAIITNAYDLEIDKACVAYERNLTESNEQMSSTVRNAKSVLQKARLMVAQQKNQYDMRGCINALDSCMQDEFVCGDDYESCLDPTGKYIVNGSVVVGSEPGLPGQADGPLYSSIWKKDAINAWGTGENDTLTKFISSALAANGQITTPKNMVEYIQQKIGYIDSEGKAQGMCVSVMNRCQDYTYTGTNVNNRSYNAGNDVVRGYMERVLVRIKARQDEILADYAESCIAEVASCLSQNSANYTWGSTYGGYGTNNDPSDIAIRACMSVINTCMSVTTRTGDTTTVKDWLNEALSTSYSTEQAKLLDKINGCYRTGGSWDESETECNCGSGMTWNSDSNKCEETKE